MSAAHANRPAGLLAYLDGETVRTLPPWIRRFLARCHPKRVIRVPLPLTGPELRDRDRTIRREHWQQRQGGMLWCESIRVLSRRHGLSRSTVVRIVKARQIATEGRLSATDVTHWH